MEVIPFPLAGKLHSRGQEEKLANTELKPEVAAKATELLKAGDRKAAKMHLSVHGPMTFVDAEKWIQAQENPPKGEPPATGPKPKGEPPVMLGPSDEYFENHKRHVERLAIGFMLADAKNPDKEWCDEVIAFLKSKSSRSFELAVKRAEAVILGRAYDYIYGDEFEG